MPSGLKASFIDVAGRCRYVKTGAGPALVLIASPLILATTYRPLLTRLACHYTVYAVEVPGSGRSFKIKSPWTFDQYADWLAQFFDRVGLDSASVIGHSNSGAIAIAFAQKYAERVDQLVLADSIGVRVRNGSILRTLFSRAWDSLVEIRLTITGFPDLLFNILFHSKNFFHQVKIAPRTDLRTQLPFVNVRTLIAWGGRDHTLPRECARLMQRSIAKASYVVSRRGSHDWLIERPNEFTDVVSRWSKPHRNLEESAPAPL